MKLMTAEWPASNKGSYAAAAQTCSSMWEEPGQIEYRSTATK